MRTTEALAAYRLKHGLSFARLAAAIGTDPATVFRACTQPERRMYATTLAKFERFLKSQKKRAA